MQMNSESTLHARLTSAHSAHHQAAYSRIPTNILTELHRPQGHEEAEHGDDGSERAGLESAGGDEEGDETGEKAPGDGGNEEDEADEEIFDWVWGGDQLGGGGKRREGGETHYPPSYPSHSHATS